MKYDKQLNEMLDKNIDIEYARFHSSIVPGSTIRGVRIPVLRKIAREFVSCDDFLYNITLDSYESISVACYYIGLTTKNIDKLKIHLDYILPYINNWAICDTFVSSLKLLKKDDGQFLLSLYNYLKSDRVYTIRFAIVCMMTYYISADTIDDLLKKILPLQNIDYYIDMAIAWFVSVAFVKCKSATLHLLTSNSLNATVQNMSISKICDSYRVNSNDKTLVKKLKIKGSKE